MESICNRETLQPGSWPSEDRSSSILRMISRRGTQRTFVARLAFDPAVSTLRGQPASESSSSQSLNIQRTLSLLTIMSSSAASMNRFITNLSRLIVQVGLWVEV